jgi:hypothetical protein
MLIKIKVFQQSSGYRVTHNHHHPVSDYTYCVYFLGFLVHSVTLHDIHRDSVQLIFGNKPIIKKKL